MINTIHIVGASGSGTTTLAKALGEKIGYKHLDSDDYFWKPTNPPFQEKRQRKKRQRLLRNDIEKYDQWILSGSMCGWGDEFITDIDLAIYLWIPSEERLKRIKQRELMKFGNRILKGGDMHKTHLEFMDYASQYDQGDLSIRSYKLHKHWLKRLECPIIRLEGLLSVDEKIKEIINRMKALK